LSTFLTSTTFSSSTALLVGKNSILGGRSNSGVPITRTRGDYGTYGEREIEGVWKGKGREVLRLGEGELCRMLMIGRIRGWEGFGRRL
jgi:hypothetical protein